MNRTLVFWRKLNVFLHTDNYRLRAKLSIKKDEIQAVIPIAKHKDLMNLAILTGRQVSRPLKVFIVSQAGDVADVTLHSSCSSADQSVLKVNITLAQCFRMVNLRHLMKVNINEIFHDL